MMGVMDGSLLLRSLIEYEVMGNRTNTDSIGFISQSLVPGVFGLTDAR